MEETKRDIKTLCRLYKKTSKKGVKYASGTMNFGDKRHYVLLFNNTNPEEDHDFTLCLGKEVVQKKPPTNQQEFL